MNRFVIAMLAASSICAQEPVAAIPRIGRIEFYGLHKLSENLIRQALGVSEGSPLPPSKAEAEERLLDIDRVVSAQLRAVCCDAGKTVLYVGIEEFGAPTYEVRPETGDSSEPLKIGKASPEWLVPMLQSIDWSERTGAVAALEQLTRKADKATLALLRGPALDSLIEMSRWRDEKYAYPALQLIGRVAGLTEVNIRDAWLRAGRDSVIAKAKAVK